MCMYAPFGVLVHTYTHILTHIHTHTHTNTHAIYMCMCVCVCVCVCVDRLTEKTKKHRLPPFCYCLHVIGAIVCFQYPYEVSSYLVETLEQ